MQSLARIMALAVFAICTCFLANPMGYAQTCVNESPWCDPWWDGSKTINNPDCLYYPAGSYLQSTTPSSGPSEGLRINPAGSPCGHTRGGFNATLRKAAIGSPLPGSVGTLLQELARVGAIYIKAQVTIINPVDGMKQTGSYEYWERGGRYRLRLGPGIRYPMEDIAFDGRFLQGRTNQTMAQISRGDKRETPFPDGPLPLALAPLRVDDPVECPSCQLRLGDLERIVRWRHEASAELAPAERAMGTGAFDAGAQRTGESDAAGRLVRLVWPADKASRQRLEITLSNYQALVGTRATFPMKMTESMAPNGTSVQYTVETVDLSGRFQDDVFDIYSTAPKLAFLTVDKKGTVHKRFLRYVPSPGDSACGAKPPAGDKQ